MTDAQLALWSGELFNKKVTSAFWSSFKGQYGRTQAEVLVYLMEHEASQASQMAEDLNIPKQHASKIVRGLMEDGLVLAAVSPEDRRANRLSLSPKGKALLMATAASSSCSTRRASPGFCPG